ncbi:copper chaperone PCu(A)C [Saccharomonospora halophila]|uniref:copper chaperone PCu(A)C n=1 Tax=Saccharomonospora halophila TaxID=129922 RepID=UPI00039FD6E4|nr:copper chaperone PCu(A)C [Saccharomonospora halophila]
MTRTVALRILSRRGSLGEKGLGEVKRRMVSAAVVAVGAALLVSGCAAGQITQTDSQVATINGTRAQAGDIAIRKAELAYPEGDDPLYRAGTSPGVAMYLVNESELRDDTLVSASTDAAANVVLNGSREVPAQGALVIAPEPQAAGVPRPELEIQTRADMTLQGLNRDVRPSQTVTMTLTFREAGRVTFDMPATIPDTPRFDVTPSPAPEGGH